MGWILLILLVILLWPAIRGYLAFRAMRNRAEEIFRQQQQQQQEAERKARRQAQGKTFDKDWCGGVNEGSVVLSGINLDACADGTKEAIDTAIAAFKAGTLHVFDTSKFTVNGSTLTEYKADVDGDFTGETNVIHDGYFDESNASQFRSAPYFDINIDGVTYINVNYGD